MIILLHMLIPFVFEMAVQGIFIQEIKILKTTKIKTVEHDPFKAQP